MSDARLGSEIAGFRIESVLGRGGMGTVYVAMQSSPRRKVALKLLRPELLEDEAFRRRFEHESEAAASTEHPNILPIYAAGEADGTLYIAMRYVEGTDLRQFIASEGPIATDRAVEIVSQIAGALDAAHARGLVHRDVKPGNVLLDAHGNAYLSDFGLIKRSEVDTNLTKTGQFMGSIEYCAPEQIRGDPVDGRADVYSLGCVLYESIAGRPPFKRETEVATLYAHLEQAPPALSSVAPASNRELDEVVKRALAKKPADRYPTAGEFARDARHAVGVASGERAAVPRRSRRGRFAVIAVIAGLVGLAVAVALVLALLAGDGDEQPATVAEPSVERAVVRIDPETGTIEESIGGFPFRELPLTIGSLAVGEGGVWVGSPPAVVHLDPRTDTVRDTISLASPHTIIAVGFRTVWVTTREDLERINPATDELLRPIPLGEPEGIVSGTEVATGEDAVWAATDRALFRIDPLTARVTGTTEVTGSDGLAVADGTVWVVDDFSGELTAFDESTGAVRDATDIAGSLDGVAAGGGSVWVLDREAGVVTVLDPETLSVLDTIRVGSDERQILFGAGAVWLADGTDGSVTSIDPISRQTTVLALGGIIEHIAIGGGTDEVWALVVPEA